MKIERDEYVPETGHLMYRVTVRHGSGTGHRRVEASFREAREAKCYEQGVRDAWAAFTSDRSE